MALPKAHRPRRSQPAHTDRQPDVEPPAAGCSYADYGVLTIKLLWWDGTGMVLYCKRLEGTHFVWPQIKDGVIAMTSAQLAMLLEGLEWRLVRENLRPQVAV
jgi:hypothetical protein